MENKANFFWIGIFVFACFFASLFVIIWISGFSNKETFNHYEIYTKESVSGLGLKAPVKLLGVDIGSVEDLQIDSKEGVGVRIYIKVKEGTPITEDTTALLQIQGITGLKYIELSGGNTHSKKLENGATIKVKESLLSSIDKQGNKIFELISLVDEKVRQVLTDENMQNLNALLKNTADLSQKLNTNIDPILANFKQALADFSSMSRSLNDTAKEFKTLGKESIQIVQNYESLKSPLAQSLDMFNLLLIQLNEISSNLKDNPSDLLFKSTINKKAPGE